MRDRSSCFIKKHSWKSLRDIFATVSPDFCKVIDEISPTENYPLYHVKYPFGAVILNKGVFQVPTSESRLMPIDHLSVSSDVKDNLGYSGTIPLGLVIDKGIETFIQTKKRILPVSFISKGNFVSLWRVLEEGHSYFLGPFLSIMSGARSICMLPKITDSTSHKILKSKYNLKLSVPQKLSDHWELFTHLANHPDFSQQWASEIIFFSKQWFCHKKDKGWNEFYRFLLNEVWQNTSHRRNQFIFDLAFSIAQEHKNLKPNPYIADTVKHLIAIGASSAPAFCAATDDNAAPISGLQKIYLEDYGLKKYAPIIMHVDHLSSENNRALYYSFQLPTTTTFSPKSRKISSAMVELQELKHIMETLLNEILKGQLGVEKTPLFNLAKNIKYEYYHSDKDKFCEISPVLNISSIDNAFTKSIIDDSEYFFPEFSSFFKGCISISYLNKISL